MISDFKLKSRLNVTELLRITVTEEQGAGPSLPFSYGFNREEYRDKLVPTMNSNMLLMQNDVAVGTWAPLTWDRNKVCQPMEARSLGFLGWWKEN